MKLFPALSLLLVSTAFSSCALPGQSLQKAAAEINATQSLDPTILDVGDAIGVRFAGNSDWDQTIRVKSDGNANFRFLGDLQVKGLSEKAVVDQVTSAYQATLQDPDVEIRVDNWAERPAFVAGELRTRGTIPLSGKRLTLVEALVRSGGHQWRTAQLNRIHFIRWIPEEARYRRWKLNASIGNWDADPIFLQPYDVIYVPPTVIARVNNWIDVYVRRNIPLPLLISRSTAPL